eukprot:364408-Prymnesium_polylepis.1
MRDREGEREREARREADYPHVVEPVRYRTSRSLIRSSARRQFRYGSSATRTPTGRDHDMGRCQEHWQGCASIARTTPQPYSLDSV